MPVYESNNSTFPALKDQVVVLTGGANGVGRSITETLFQAGAHVVFGDIDEAACRELVDGLESVNAQGSGSVASRKVDVRSYEDNLGLFEHAFKKHGRVDHALSVAGVTEGENWFDPGLDLESVRTRPSTAVLDINLLGAIYFARIAVVYLRQGAHSGHDKSLLLLGSLASFREQSGLYVYSPAKHGVMGLFRATRKTLYGMHNIRSNILCPSLISTAMSSRIQHIWEEKGLPINSAKEVADVALSITATPRLGEFLQTGLAVYVEGGQGWEFESELDRLSGQWMGAEMAENCHKINEALGLGSSWAEERSKL